MCNASGPTLSDNLADRFSDSDSLKPTSPICEGTTAQDTLESSTSKVSAVPIGEETSRRETSQRTKQTKSAVPWRTPYQLRSSFKKRAKPTTDPPCVKQEPRKQLPPKKEIPVTRGVPDQNCSPDEIPCQSIVQWTDVSKGESVCKVGYVGQTAFLTLQGINDAETPVTIYDMSSMADTPLKLLQLNPGAAFNAQYDKDLIGNNLCRFYKGCKPSTNRLQIKVGSQKALISQKDFFDIPAHVPFRLKNVTDKPIQILLKLSS